MERILVVDHSARMQEAIREILEPEGFRVVGEAGDGCEAIPQFEALRPDFVLLDLLIPGRPGLEVLQAIRSLDGEIPVVVSADLGRETLAAEAIVSGANDFVLKPFHPFRLLATLWRVQRKRLVPARPS
ncbi:MAG: response regulator [Myxococcota bacterium]|nr:response regulator [Myxococcota bacterium]